ncbi:hypothetical protein Tdes44962_MAKER03943 [Teratosphaeria destructans]|uniref:Uncharacterized protein n=1 Tax=Teratosphaeria destructans TaxID=418781 RepID=A0A9W7SNV6_9PEZI|nr:hypothetical protein Tdes44962_MAKER03943 [Teratosphaeria destructans]
MGRNDVAYVNRASGSVSAGEHEYGGTRKPRIAENDAVPALGEAHEQCGERRRMHTRKGR